MAVVREIMARVDLRSTRAEIGPDAEAMFDSPEREGKCPAPMGERDPQLWKALEDAAKNHRANRECGFRRHSDQPWQPEIRHAFLPDHVPGVNKNRGSEFFGFAPDGLQRRIIEVDGIEPAEMLVRVHMAANLRAS